MDPWLEGQIRLAERRGILQGRHISPVQQMALQLLIILDRADAASIRADRIREALLGANPALARGLYPAYFSSEESPVPEETTPGPSMMNHDPETAYDFSEMTFEHPRDLKDEDMAMLSRLLGNKDVTVGGPLGAEEEVEEVFDVAKIEDSEWT